MSASVRCLLVFTCLQSGILALTIDVNCGGVAIGAIDVNPVAVGGQVVGVSGGFFPTPPLNLAGAVALCNQDHFNWRQTVMFPMTNPPIVPPGRDAQGNPLPPVFLDPPPGGYGDDPATLPDDTQWADNLPLYWDESVPPPGTPGFDPRNSLANNTTNTELRYEDFPSFKLFPAPAKFDVELISVEKDGTYVPLTSFFYSFGTSGGTTCTTSEYRNPVQTCSSSNPGVFELGTVPEPGSLILVIVGFIGIALKLRSKRHIIGL